MMNRRTLLKSLAGFAAAPLAFLRRKRDPLDVYCDEVVSKMRDDATGTFNTASGRWWTYYPDGTEKSGTLDIKQTEWR